MTLLDELSVLRKARFGDRAGDVSNSGVKIPTELPFGRVGSRERQLPAMRGADYYVAIDIGDAIACSESKPFKTVAKAAQVATSPGGHGLVRGGMMAALGTPT